MITNIPKGTKDILPSQINKWHYVEGVFGELCSRYGYKEIRTPIFEHTELFKRSVGDTTDIVEKQMYSFQDYGKRNITLKPEGTSAVVRSFVENKLFADVTPAKYFYNIPCFRYEKPQSGRLRQFHQFGVELFGSADMMADAEVIALAKDFLDILGIRDLELRINSIGCPQCRTKYREALQAFLKPKYEQLCDTCTGRYERNPMRILDCKSPVCQELVQGAPVMLDYLCDDCREAFEEIKKNLSAMELEFTVDTGIVRGLDYYTKTAFEFVSGSIGAQGTVCGGGRYDNLIEEIGGPATPGVGFGLGIERLLMVMEANGIKIPEEEPAEVFVAVMGDRAKVFGQKLVHDLRKVGVRAALDVMARNIKGQFKYADRIHAVYTIVIGDNELNQGKVALKTMATSQQREIPIEDIMKEIRK